MPRLQVEFGSDMGFFVGLCLLEAVGRIGVIGTAVLAVAVQEKVVEIVAQVVVVCDVAACLIRRVATKPSDDVAKCFK